MARRTLNEPTKELNKNVGGLLKETNEAGKLGSILDLIEQQQQDLKGYIDRIESASKDLENLEARKVNALAEVSKIEDANEVLKVSLERELKSLKDEIESRNKELGTLKLKLKEESESAEEQIKEWQNKVKSEESRFEESVKQHQQEMGVLKEEQDLIKKDNDLLNTDLLKLKEDNVKESGLLNGVIDNKNRVLGEIKELEKQKSDLEDAVSGFVSSLEDLKSKALELEDKNEQIVKDGLASFKELEVQSQKELKDIEEEKRLKREQLKKTDESLVEMTTKLEAIKGEYDKIVGEIAGFISKKNEVDRKEERIKEQYKKAGLNY